MLLVTESSANFAVVIEPLATEGVVGVIQSKPVAVLDNNCPLEPELSVSILDNVTESSFNSAVSIAPAAI